MSKAIVQQDVERIPEVSRTWIEWGEQGLKTLVVEVTFDTDPNSIDFNQTALEEIEKTASGATTTMVINHSISLWTRCLRVSGPSLGAHG